MIRSFAASALAVLVLACEPDEPDDPEPPGTLEFEHSYARIYRLDHRVDIAYVRTMGEPERHGCGILSERAHTELEDTLESLDSREDYGYDPNVQECASSPGAEILIEGFEHSPFLCDFMCCHRDLARAALIYTLIESHFVAGQVLEFDGEPYVAIEPDTPCP
ncbi:hypothetical protein [Paraliomyxa miuraensis]|uniref:hypothetical protein n=1 Tax=Paraliomyxa miuraensis TaxID=376150 RepID=UPI00225820F6|nr:hypothetical protein [Paraliomyxa miuraensis]MCX4241837.1 hypothetical protein [Paraliomyxa miuraensis]